MEDSQGSRKASPARLGLVFVLGLALGALRNVCGNYARARRAYRAAGSRCRQIRWRSLPRELNLISGSAKCIMTIINDTRARYAK